MILPYTPDHRTLWDRTIDESRNGTFLLHRSYMDYHRERFEDASLLWQDQRGRKQGLFPACWHPRLPKTIVSHAGLTYGGCVLSPRIGLVQVGEMLHEILAHYKQQGAETLIVKPIPQIYATLPAEEELYWINRLGGRLTARSASQTVALQEEGVGFSTLRRRKVKRAEGEGCCIVDDTKLDDLPAFWQILDETLRSRHQVAPVHTLEEIRRLIRDNAPHIRLFTIRQGNQLVAGTLFFEMNPVVHAQYIAASSAGRELGALDFLFHHLIERYRQQGYRFLDFGISTEEGGQVLNEGLTFQKEGFGGRTICYDAYTIPIL